MSNSRSELVWDLLTSILSDTPFFFFFWSSRYWHEIWISEHALFYESIKANLTTTRICNSTDVTVKKKTASHYYCTWKKVKTKQNKTKNHFMLRPLPVSTLVTKWATMPIGQNSRHKETECRVSISFSIPSWYTCLNYMKREESVLSENAIAIVLYGLSIVCLCRNSFSTARSKIGLQKVHEKRENGR